MSTPLKVGLWVLAVLAGAVAIAAVQVHGGTDRLAGLAYAVAKIGVSIALVGFFVIRAVRAARPKVKGR